MKNTSIAIGLGISALTSIVLQAAPAQAANFSFTGNLANPNAKAQYSFTADGVSTVTIQSSSWAAGGFDPNLTIFNPDGTWRDEREDIGLNNLDFRYTGILPAGTYQAVIAAFGNNSAGFGTITTPFNGAGDFGRNAVGANRTSAFAFDILNVTSASTTTAVPEPFTIVGTLLGGASALRMRKRFKATNKL
jgi:hypothetical protein